MFLEFETNRIYCEECGKYEEFFIMSVPMAEIIMGEEYIYIGYQAHCLNCGSVLFIPEIEEMNTLSLYKTYSEETNFSVVS